MRLAIGEKKKLFIGHYGYIQSISEMLIDFDSLHYEYSEIFSEEERKSMKQKIGLRCEKRSFFFLPQSL
jgi:hypothetical protein